MTNHVAGILVSLVAPMKNHVANGGEKLLGNASSIKRRNDGRVYISGQMQRHVFFSAIERLNLTDSDRGDTYVSNGDGISNKVEVDLRADIGGFMHPSKGDYSGRRTSPLTVTPAVSQDASDITRDLLVRIKMNEKEGSRDQALATREFSDADKMVMNFFLDVSALSISKKFNYDKEFHLGTEYIKHVPEKERKRRATLYLRATKAMNDFASQARNSVSGEPQQVLIVFDIILSRKASRYFEAETSDKEKQNILKELDSRGVVYFLGDDMQGDFSVNDAYQSALKYLDTTVLFDPTGGDEKILPFEKAFSGK